MKVRGRITDCRPTTTDKEAFVKWLVKNNGMYFIADYKIPGKRKDKKSLEQLGYYWAVLVPLITKELNAQGHTMTLNLKDIHRETPYDEGSTHEMLTQLCGNVGPDGAFMRLSDDDMTIGRMIQFISNVLDVAVISLGMDGDKLKAWRPDDR